MATSPLERYAQYHHWRRFYSEVLEVPDHEDALDRAVRQAEAQLNGLNQMLARYPPTIPVQAVYPQPVALPESAYPLQRALLDSSASDTDSVSSSDVWTEWDLLEELKDTVAEPGEKPCVGCHQNCRLFAFQCGHFVTCGLCTRTIINGNGKCPMCRKRIVHLLRIWSS